MAASSTFMQLACGLVVAQFLLPAAWASDHPLSAIDWLSNSVAPPQAEPAPKDVTPLAALPSEIAVLPLDGNTPDGVGLQPAEQLGLAPGLWGRSSAADLARALSTLPDGSNAPPVLNRFLRDVLTGKFDPPIDAAIDDRFFLARIDRLLSMGHLQEADEIIRRAGPEESRRFRRAFDIALLAGTETEACRIIEKVPDISPTYPARIFCLARLGNWDVAALTLGNAEALGILTPEEEGLLLHFLDPELFEDDPLPAPPRLPSPLQFRLFEALGERIPTEQLPVAFAVADLSSKTGWKARLRAAERLAAAGALPISRLLEVYAEGKPAASGGIWERVSAVGSLMAALETNDGELVSSALAPAWQAAKAGGYEKAFAKWVAAHLEGLDLSDPAMRIAFEIALLAEDAVLAEHFAGGRSESRFLLAIAKGLRGALPGPNMLSQAVVRGLAAHGPGPAYRVLIEGDRGGEALFRALLQLMDGAAGNPHATQQSLMLLRALGLEPLARQVAIELVLEHGKT